MSNEPQEKQREICTENCGGNVNACRKGVNGFDNTPVELRGGCPRWIIDVLDAEALASGQSRLDLVNKVLEPWALQRIHAANLIQRITRVKGTSLEAIGKDSE